MINLARRHREQREREVEGMFVLKLVVLSVRGERDEVRWSETLQLQEDDCSSNCDAPSLLRDLVTLSRLKPEDKGEEEQEEEGNSDAR